MALSKGIIFTKKADFLQKSNDISNIKNALVRKGIFTETSNVCILTCQVSSF